MSPERAYERAVTTARPSATSALTTDDPAKGPRNITSNSAPTRRIIMRSCVALIRGGGAGGGSNPPGDGGQPWESKNMRLGYANGRT